MSPSYSRKLVCQASNWSPAFGMSVLHFCCDCRKYHRTGSCCLYLCSGSNSTSLECFHQFCLFYHSSKEKRPFDRSPRTGFSSFPWVSIFFPSLRSPRPGACLWFWSSRPSCRLCLCCQPALLTGLLQSPYHIQKPDTVRIEQMFVCSILAPLVFS